MPITINSRILLSAASIAAAAALVIGATFAFFSDSETSEDNVFAAGTLDLALCDDDENDDPNPCVGLDEGPEDGTTATFGAEDMAPGDCTGDQTLTLRNNGTVDGNHVDIKATNTDSGMAAFLRIDKLTYDSGSQLPLGDFNLNGISDLDDLANQTADDLVNLNGIAADGSTDLVMNVCLDEDAGNNLQGDSNTLELTVTLDQGPHPVI